MIEKINFKRTFILLYGIFLFIIYISLINNSKGYEWDAANIASWADSGKYIFPGQQNHLLQSILNMIWCNTWKFFGYSKGCLMPLRVLSCIFGALGVIGFFILLYKIFKKNIIALFGSLGLAFSIFYWAFSTDLETHILPISVFIYCLILLFNLYKFDSRKAILLGFFHSLCIYLSGIYIFFIPALIFGIIMIIDNTQNQYKALILYLFSLLLFWAVPFLIIGIYFYKVNLGLRYANNFIKHLFIWFRGFEKLIPFHWNNLIDIRLYYCYFRNIHYINKFNNLTIVSGIIAIIFYITFFLAFLKDIKYIVKKFSKILLVIFSIIIPYQLILLIYQPFDAERYVNFLPAVWLLLSCMTYPLFITKKKLLRVWPFILIALIFWTNLIFYIYPKHLAVIYE